MSAFEMRRQVKSVTLHLAADRELRLVLEGDVSKVRLEELPVGGQVVLAIDSSTVNDREAALEPRVRNSLGDRVWATFFDARDPSQMCEDLLLAAYLASGLLDRGATVVLVVSAAAGVELLAAAVLLVRGFSQPAAITAIRAALPDAFPEIDNELALAAIDEARRAREAHAARTA